MQKCQEWIEEASSLSVDDLKRLAEVNGVEVELALTHAKAFEEQMEAFRVNPPAGHQRGRPSVLKAEENSAKCSPGALDALLPYRKAFRKRGPF